MLSSPLALWCLRIGTRLAVCGACLAAVVVQAQTWPRSTPEAQGIDSRGIAQLLAQMQRENIGIHSFAVIRHGHVVAEAYRYPYTATTRHVLYSGSKSFTSALLGIAIEQGLISGVDEHVVDFFPDKLPATVPENLRQMRLRHLLTMSTGHASDTMSRITSTNDWVKAFLALPVENTPGSRFVYNSGATVMLSAAIQQRSGMNLLAFAERHLFPKLGITDYTWEAGPNQLTAGGWGLSLRLLDFARLGQLYLKNGEFNGQRVVPADWVAESTHSHIDSNNVNPFWGSGYGYQFWMNDFGGYRADGAYGQYAFVLPEYDAVVVFNSHLSDTEMPAKLVRRWLLPAMRSASPLPDNPAAVALIERSAAVLAASSSTSLTFTTLPQDCLRLPGEPATFAAEARGATSYQWFKDGAAISGATSATLTLASVTPEQAGRYSVEARNATSSLMSYAVELKVGWSQLVALSSRAPAGTGEQTLIMGFAFAGAGSKPLLVRGVGPGLLAGAPDLAGRLLNDPRLTLHNMDDGTTTAENDNWGGTAALRTAFAATGVGGLADASADAALVADLSGNLYSAHVTGADGGVGVALAEAYDADASRHDRRLKALSVRNQVGVGGDILIAGFVLTGEMRRPMIIRGLGPALVPAVSSGAVLANPVLRLHRYVNGQWELVASNDNWDSSAAAIQAFRTAGLAPITSSSLDAVLLLDLEPGIYTAQLSGARGTTGVGLIEVYEGPIQ